MISRQILALCTRTQVRLAKRSLTLSGATRFSAAAAAQASGTPVMSPTEVDPKIRDIVSQISKLTLLEVSELNQALKETLKIPDAPVMSFAAGAAPGAASSKAEDEDADNSKSVQTAFTLKITKFDDTKKVALIKEIKNVVEGLNLVQAKKFVESVPQVVKSNISKDEAEKLKSALEAAGASCTID